MSGGKGLAVDAEALLDIDVARLTDVELSEHLLALDALRSRVDAAFRRTVGVWDARQVWVDDGAATGAAWLAHRAGLSGQAARAEVRTARRLRDLPALAAASERGELCAAKVRLIAAAAVDGDDVVNQALARDEAMLIGEAKRLTVDQTGYLVRHWKACVDADGSRDDERRLHQRRSCTLDQTFGGAWVLRAVLDPEAGAIVANVLGGIADDLYRANRDGDRLDISATQRRADALVEMARRATAADPDQAASVPLVVVDIDLETLEGRVDRPCTINSRGQITAQVARRLACDAGVARVISGPDSAPIDLGRTRREPSAAQRRALSRRDRGCVFPGCDRPPGWCAAHHLIHWIPKGPTDLDNLVLLCSHHHHLVHEGGFGAARGPDGHVHFTRPDGTEITTRPAA